MAINSANQVTRMGMAGAMWQPHGSYSGKVPGAVVTPNEPQREPVEGGGGWPGHGIYKKKRHEKAILQDDEDLMRIIQEALPAILKFLRR